MNEKRSALTRAAAGASDVFHAAGADYLAARATHAPEEEFTVLVEYCIVTGEFYRTTLEVLLAYLKSREASNERYILRMENLLAQLVVELENFYTIRRAENP